MKDTSLILFILLFFSNCEIFQDNFTTVEGHVTDRVTGKPVSGIRVHLCSSEITSGQYCKPFKTTHSDSIGYYQLSADIHTKFGKGFGLKTSTSQTYYASGEIRFEIGEKNTIDIQLKPK